MLTSIQLDVNDRVAGRKRYGDLSGGEFDSDDYFGQR